jgi:hypothetical protein
MLMPGFEETAGKDVAMLAMRLCFQMGPHRMACGMSQILQSIVVPVLVLELRMHRAQKDRPQRTWTVEEGKSLVQERQKHRLVPSLDSA